MTISSDELARRLRRIHAAFRSTKEPDISKFRAEIDEDFAHLDFKGDMTDEDLQNFLWSAIHNTSTLYSYLKVWATGNEVVSKEIDEINENSRALQILRTLDNKDKHPKARNPKTSESLSLAEIRRVLQLTAAPGETSRLSVLADGTLVRKGSASVVIDADVVNDKTGEILGRLSGILEDAIQTWEHFMSRAP